MKKITETKPFNRRLPTDTIERFESLLRKMQAAEDRIIEKDELGAKIFQAGLDVIEETLSAKIPIHA